MPTEILTQDALEILACMLDGECHHTGGGFYVTLITKPDGSIVAFSENGIGHYPNEQAWVDGFPSAFIDLETSNTKVGA